MEIFISPLPFPTQIHQYQVWWDKVKGVWEEIERSACAFQIPLGFLINFTSQRRNKARTIIPPGLHIAIFLNVEFYDDT